MEYKLEAMILAATKVSQMVDFYTNVFDIQFEEQQFEDGKLYEGKWAGFDFTIVPSELSNFNAGQNPMHYDIFVPDIQAVIELATKHGGRTNGKIGEDEEIRAIGIYDPDENFMVFKQRK